jgi:hypothetical protein
MLRLKTYLAVLSTWTAIACATLLGAALVIIGVAATISLVGSLALPRTVQIAVLEQLGLYSEAKEIRSGASSSENVEEARGEVFPDLWAIASWVSGCTRTNTQFLVPTEFMAAFYRKQPYYNEPAVVRPTAPPDIPRSDRPAASTQEAVPSSAQPTDSNQPKVLPRAPSRQELALIQLSYAIAKHRVEARTKAQAAYSLWQYSTLITIAIGMITTILVSLSATDFVQKGGAIALTIRILAIVFPAVGTAFAAVIAFYGPQAEWSQSSRTFASLSQLHGQMALDIFKIEDCQPAPPKDSDLAKQLEIWGKNYKDIETLATAASSASGGGQGGPPTGNQETGQKGQAGGKPGDAPPGAPPGQSAPQPNTRN